MREILKKQSTLRDSLSSQYTNGTIQLKRLLRAHDIPTTIELVQIHEVCEIPTKQ